MDLENQRRVLDLSTKYSAENIVVVLGVAEAETAGLTAETVTAGDPTFAGPLAGVPLGLQVYHMFELKDQVDASIYEDECGMMEMVLDVEALSTEVKSFRDLYSKS